MTQEQKHTALALTHPFMAAGLGEAPFKLMGMRENLYYPCTGIDGKPDSSVPPVAGGCCAYCGQGIRYEYVIRSKDGKECTVGSDCVAKVGDTKLVSAAKLERRRLDKQRKADEYAANRDRELTAQRERNGGLTDQELAIARKAEADKLFQIKREEILAPLSGYFNVLRGTKGNFAGHMVYNFDEYRELPSVGAVVVVAEIVAKTLYKKGTEAFFTEHSKVIAEFNAASDAVPDGLP